MSELLKKVYASAPSEHVIIQTLEIKPPNASPIYVCTGFEDIVAKLEDETSVTFIAGNLAVSRPKRSDKIDQTLSFGIWNVAKEAHNVIVGALESDEQTDIIYREYLYPDMSQPAFNGLTFAMVGGSFEGMMCTIEAAVFDALNTAYPRERFTNLNAPAIQYM